MKYITVKLTHEGHPQDYMDIHVCIAPKAWTVTLAGHLHSHAGEGDFSYVSAERGVLTLDNMLYLVKYIKNRLYPLIKTECPFISDPSMYLGVNGDWLKNITEELFAEEKWVCE